MGFRSGSAGPCRATREELEECVRMACRMITAYHGKQRTLFCADTASVVNPSASRRRMLRRGWREAVPVNYSKREIHVLGTISREVVELDYSESLKAGV